MAGLPATADASVNGFVACRTSAAPGVETFWFGYTNTGTTAVVIPKGVLTRNYFSPGSTTYSNQPTVFQPGTSERVFTLDLDPAAATTWFLDGGSTKADATVPLCGLGWRGA